MGMICPGGMGPGSELAEKDSRSKFGADSPTLFPFSGGPLPAGLATESCGDVLLGPGPGEACKCSRGSEGVAATVCEIVTDPECGDRECRGGQSHRGCPSL